MNQFGASRNNNNNKNKTKKNKNTQPMEYIFIFPQKDSRWNIIAGHRNTEELPVVSMSINIIWSTCYTHGEGSNFWRRYTWQFSVNWKSALLTANIWYVIRPTTVQLRTHCYTSATKKRREQKFHETRVYVRMTRKLRNDVYHPKMLLSGVILVNSKNVGALVWMNSRESNRKPTEKDRRLTAKSILYV